LQSPQHDIAANGIINRAAMGQARFMFYPWFIVFCYFFFVGDQTQISTWPTLNYAICNVYSPNLVSSGHSYVQGQQKSQITKSRRTYTLQKNLFKTPTSKRYITLALIATTHRQKVNLFLNNPALSC